MRHMENWGPSLRDFTSVLAVVTVLLTVAPARAQTREAGDESPRVTSLGFEGVGGVSRSELEEGIVTQPTRCRGPLLWPLCKVSGSRFFWAKHDLDREELERDELRLRVIYFRRGYRQARVESSVTPDDDGVAVTFTIDEGPLTRIGSLTVAQTEPLLTERQVRQARLPPEGGPLDLVHLDSARVRLRSRLWDRGYADTQIRDSALIDPVTHLAALDVRVDPGARTTIGDVAVEGNERISERTILRIFDLQPGQLYRRADMTAAQRRLYQTELFRQSLLQVPETTDSVKDVVITVQEAPPRAVRAGPGFNTTEFLQAEARFTRYNWMGGARRLDTRVAVGNILAPQLYGRSIFGSGVPDGIGREVDDAYLAPTWHAGVDLTQPFFLSSRNAVGVGVSAHRRSVPGIVVDRGLAVNVSFTRRLADDFPVSVTYRFEQTHVDAGQVYFCVNFGVCDPFTISGLERAHRLSPLALVAHVERADDPLAPTTGWMARAEVEHASAATLSDFRYHRVAGETSRYFRLKRAVVAGRVRAAWVRPLQGTLDAFELPEGALTILHPRRRLFAGGARSVRGFGENQLGPRVLTIPSDELIEPAEGTDTPACTLESVSDGTCDPNAAPSRSFQPRPLGGNTLLEASVEYRFPLTRSMTGAVFVDAGLLRGQRVNFPPGTRSALTPGVGIRYTSPIGPVRLDLGFRPSLAEELPVVTQLVGEDGEFRLVQLETLKRYDPLEDRGGFLGGFLSRLQLHLAIGEAF